MSTHQNLSDSFLYQLQKNDINVSIFLVNGIKLHGLIEAYDNEVIMLKNAITQMIYKHSISTVVPSRIIQYMPGANP